MKRSFVRVSITLALALSALTASAQDVTISDSARQHFKTGVAYLTDPDGARYEEAYAEFKAAYADSPSWKILGNLGITALKLERDGEAIDSFQKYLQGGKDQIEASERAQMEKDLMTTQSGVVYLNIKSDPPTALIVDERQPLAGRAVTNRYDLAADGALRIGVRRGRHRVTAKLDGYNDAIWEFDADPGAEQTHEFKLVKIAAAPAAVVGAAAVPATPGTEPAMHRPIPVPVYVGAAATGGLLVGSVVVGVLGISKKSDFNKANDGHHVAEAQSLHDSGNTLNIVGDVLLAGGVVAGVVTTILFLNRPEVPVGGAPEHDTGKLRVEPLVGTSSAALLVSGGF
jgi:hypothetical protein